MSTELKKQPRPIIEEFAKEISATKLEIPNDKPIKFRDDIIRNKIRKAFKVPIELLRFRKDNGRIASDVLTYEFNKGPINETTDYGQSIVRKFLEKKDPDPTKELTNSIIKDGQNLKAIITADGFLINGNRRKMVLETLLDSNKGNERYKYLEVVILPGLNQTEPVPTIEEIEQIENRYQFQREGKAEYYNFDMALAVQRKLDMGFDIEEILLDDPNYEVLKGKALKTKIQKFKDEYLEPLKCVDRYLAFLNRPGHYNTVSEGRGDSEGRWQAFRDYYNSVYKKLINDKQRIDLGVRDGEEGKIENVAFKIIRQREIKGVDKKAHQIMREFPKLLKNTHSKKELFNLLDIRLDLPLDETINENGEQVDERTKDVIWGNKNASKIINHVRNAFEYVDQRQEMDTPLELLNASLDKLNHPKMNIDSIDTTRLNEAMKITRDIQIKANDLEHQLYDKKRNKESLAEKFNTKRK